MDTTTTDGIAEEGLMRAAGRAVEDEFVAGVRATLQEIISHDASLSQAKVAELVGISGSALSLWLRDEYAGNPVNIARKIQLWVSSRAQRQLLQAAAPDIPRWFDSPTSRAITTALSYAQALEDMVAIVGVPGIGKSVSCREYRREHPNVWIATMAPQRAALSPVIREICAAVGAAHASSGDGLAREAAKKIRGRQGLLIIDEAHHIATAGLDAIRSLHDETQVGVALVGGPPLLAKIEQMPQLQSRIGLRLPRASVSQADVDALLDAWEITDRTARGELSLIAQRPGALRSVTKTLRLAASISRGANDTLGLSHIRQAARTLSSRTEDTDA